MNVGAGKLRISKQGAVTSSPPRAIQAARKLVRVEIDLSVPADTRREQIKSLIFGFLIGQGLSVVTIIAAEEGLL